MRATHWQTAGDEVFDVLIIGAGAWGREVARRIRAAEWLGMDIAAYLDSDVSLHGHDLDDAPVVGGFDDIEEAISTRRIDEVWICLPLGSTTSSAGFIGARSR